VDIYKVAFGDVQRVFPSPWSEAFCILVAFCCGAIVGFERERGHKPAGLRTQILICVGSAIFTLVSCSSHLAGREPARIAAQIVTGVGFLGAGSILRDRHQITGLTTAATIWAVSAIGIVAGAGYVAAALALSVAVLLVLASFRQVEILLAGRCNAVDVLVVYQPEKGKTRALIVEMLDESRGHLRILQESERPDGLREMHVSYCDRHRDHRAFLAALAAMPAVDGLERRDPA
jgi:putative Mg2+ transporter-C (MgtC) family protein